MDQINQGKRLGEKRVPPVYRHEECRSVLSVPIGFRSLSEPTWLHLAHGPLLDSTNRAGSEVRSSTPVSTCTWSWLVPLHFWYLFLTLIPVPFPMVDTVLSWYTGGVFPVSCKRGIQSKFQFKRKYKTKPTSYNSYNPKCNHISIFNIYKSCGTEG